MPACGVAAVVRAPSICQYRWVDLVGLGDEFPGHYWPTEEQLQHLWGEGVLVLDASVLLGFYRYSEETREAMFRVLARFADRVFVPHQAAEEFQRNRLAVIGQQVAVYAEIKNDLTKSVEALRQRAHQLRRHPVLEADEVLGRLDAFQADLSNYIKQRSLEHPNRDLTPSTLMRDPIRGRIEAAVGRAVGQPFGDERQKEAEQQAALRFEFERPPGFRDKHKGDPRQFGDVFFWLQTLDFASKAARPILLVTDDEKDDWWWMFRGRTLGPRSELVAEMHAIAQQPMFMYTSRGLLEAARTYLSESVSDDAIDEIEQVAHDLRTRTTSEPLECPHCGWSPVAVRIGLSAGSSAIARCPSCEHRFHAHRVGTGEVRTSRGSLGRRLHAHCPSCSSVVRVDFADGDEAAKERVCLDCYLLLRIENTGLAAAVGAATVVDSEVVDDRHLRCPRCEASHATFAQRHGAVFAQCYSSEPPLLLRGQTVGLSTLDPD